MDRKGQEEQRDAIHKPWGRVTDQAMEIWSMTGQFVRVEATVTPFEAKTRFGELLERVAKGEEVVITRHDKAVAPGPGGRTTG